MPAFPEPTDPAESRADVLLRYLDFYRDTAVEKARLLPSGAVRASALPSGWSPLELLHHLRHVERRWLVWGFEGEAVDDPWADRSGDRWHVPADLTLDDVVALLVEQGATTRAVVSRHDLDDVGQPSDRWDGADPPTLERVLLHLVQEYARHVGHLDVVVELATGATGE